MNHFTLQSYLSANIDIDNQKLQELLSKCAIKLYKSGSFLLKEGEKSQFSFFVEKGLLRQYSIDNKGKEHIIQFAPEKWFLADRESVYLKQPSSYFIQALEDTEVFLIEEKLMDKLSASDNNFMRFNNQLLHKHIASLQKRITQLQSATAEERYLDFIKTYPDILLRVPQTMVASYLGITPESLSRIRKGLAEKNYNSSC
ncbi:MAG: Crp/Fnr family transcriptional regulator [Chitinophagales bacterium]|nr:Crp/Fnr family transcriptional regulator [Bacteroidota bacterium]MCB9226818.1 Crp/Fnr family transcriptional regulator [Chitinophagales bacterium]